MKKLRRRGVALLLALALAASPVSAVSSDELADAVEESASYLLTTVPQPQVSSMGGEWAVLGLARSGCAVPSAYWDSYLRTAEQEVTSRGGVLHERKYTEYSRMIIALTAIGADPTDVAGFNLLTPLGDFEKTVRQGINGSIWALIALDAGNYDIPVDPGSGIQTTRQLYINEILSRQLDDGGWSLSGRGAADADITAMALQALAKYQSQEAVRDASERALACLGAMQDADGGYSSQGTPNTESTAQVVVALCELGLGTDDPRFIKNGSSPLDALLRCRRPDGSFLHTADGSGSSQMACEQGFYALVAALRLSEGKSSLYRMADDIPPACAPEQNVHTLLLLGTFTALDAALGAVMPGIPPLRPALSPGGIASCI